MRIKYISSYFSNFACHYYCMMHRQFPQQFQMHVCDIAILAIHIKLICYNVVSMFLTLSGGGFQGFVSS